jgi:hypothetical protein
MAPIIAQISTSAQREQGYAEEGVPEDGGREDGR